MASLDRFVHSRLSTHTLRDDLSAVELLDDLEHIMMFSVLLFPGK